MPFLGRDPYYIADMGYRMATEVNDIRYKLEYDLGIEFEVTGKDTIRFIKNPELFRGLPEHIERLKGSKGEYITIRLGSIEIREKKSKLMRGQIGRIRSCFRLVHELFVLTRLIKYLIDEGAKLLDKEISLTPGAPIPKEHYGNRISFEYLDSKMTILYQPQFFLKIRGKRPRPDFVIVNDHIPNINYFAEKYVDRGASPPVKCKVVVLDPKVSFNKEDYDRLLRYEELFPKGSKFLVLALDEETVPANYKGELEDRGWIIIENVKPDSERFEDYVVNIMKGVFRLT